MTEEKLCERCGTVIVPAAEGALCEDCAARVPRLADEQDEPRPSTLPDTIGGHKIISVLGEGGMGTVYLARDPVLEREVALKVVRPEILKPELASRHLEEAILTGSLAHPCIVPVHQMGEDPEHGPYYTMKRLQGRPFSDVLEGLRQRQPLDVETYTLPVLLHVFLRACEAIAFAHHNGVVNRDLKPGNIMLGEFGEVMVLDWGLARLPEGTRKRPAPAAPVEPPPVLDTDPLEPAAAAEPPPTPVHSDAHFTRDGIIVGTPGYMSPEQAAGMGSVVGPASDVYSLGAILYEILTLQPPVDVDDPDEAIRATLRGDIVPVQKRGAGRSAPRAVVQICETAMQADPAHRYPTARELARAVDDYIAGRTPWRPALEEDGASVWDIVSGRWARDDAGLKSAGGQQPRLVHRSEITGDVRFTASLMAEVDRNVWEASVWLAVRGGFSVEGYQVRFAAGPDGRVELLRGGVAAARRLDIHLGSRTRYDIAVTREGDRIAVLLNGARIIEYRDLFPLVGPCVALSCDAEGIAFYDPHLEARGAPLQLTFLALPDKLFQLGKVREARELYREMAETHPDREEGLLARYKASACALELGYPESAREELDRLEGTAMEALIPLGRGRMALKEGGVAAAIEALSEGCQRYPDDTLRVEMWTLLMATVDASERSSPEKAWQITQDLIRQRWLGPGEIVQVCAEMLRLAAMLGGPARVRDEAMRVLDREPESVEVRMECHAALARAGMTPDLISRCREALQQTLSLGTHLAARDRWLTLLRLAETQIADGDLANARRTLEVVHIGATHPSNEGAWARNWLALLSIIEGRPQDALVQLRRESTVYAATRSPQELFSTLLECAALIHSNRLDDGLKRLDEAATRAPEWAGVVASLSGKAPLEALWSFGGSLSPNLAAELYLLAAEVFAGRRNISPATLLRARAIQVSAGRAMALWLVSRRTKM